MSTKGKTERYWVETVRTPVDCEPSLRSVTAPLSGITAGGGYAGLGSGAGGCSEFSRGKCTILPKRASGVRTTRASAPACPATALAIPVYPLICWGQDVRGGSRCSTDTPFPCNQSSQLFQRVPPPPLPSASWRHFRGPGGNSGVIDVDSAGSAMVDPGIEKGE